MRLVSCGGGDDDDGCSRSASIVSKLLTVAGMLECLSMRFSAVLRKRTMIQYLHNTSTSIHSSISSIFRKR